MRRVTVDTTEAQSFEATEPGPYTMVVDEIEDPTPSKEKATLGGFWYFHFADPTIAKKCGRVRRWYPIEGKGAGFFRELWKACTGEDIPMDTKIDVDLDDALGRTVIASVGNEEYEGRLQNTIEKVVAAN